MFVLGKDIRNIKTSIFNIRIKHSENEWILFLGLDYSARSPNLSSFALPFSAFFIYLSIDPTYFVQFSSLLVFTLL